MNIQTRLGGWAVALAGAALFLAVPARANIIISVGDVFAIAGSTGNGIDVTLTNTGPSAINVGGFNFQISTSDTDITFQSTTISTLAPYVFLGDSLFGSPINTCTSPCGQSIDGSDLAASAGDLVAAGATVGLGHVLFDVAGGATPGPFVVTLAGFPGTSLAGAAPAGANIPIDTFTDGQITITAVPEPASALLLISALGALVAVKRRRR
jgi:hypothetical protein